MSTLFDKHQSSIEEQMRFWISERWTIALKRCSCAKIKPVSNLRASPIGRCYRCDGKFSPS
jgi:hypothetical protein